MPDLSQAIGVYVGAGERSFPKESLSRVVARFGVPAGLWLGLSARTVVKRLRRIKPDWDRHDLSEASEAAAEAMCGRDKRLNDEARQALVWIYSWWWK